MHGDFRYIEQNEQLPTVAYESNGDIIGILDHEGIFHGLYDLHGKRVKITKRHSHIIEMGLGESHEFPDGELRVVGLGLVVKE